MRRTIFHVFICLFAYLLLGIFSSSAFAAPTQPAPQLGTAGARVGLSWPLGQTFGLATHEAETKLGVTNGETSVQFWGYSAAQTFNKMIGGCSGFPEVSTQYPDHCKMLNQQSAMGGVNNLIYAMVVNPPASTSLALLDFGTTLGFIPKRTMAQGIGFNGLQPLLPIWKGFRNIAYSILAILMIVVGFMVMFRKKIDTKTVVTVQNALPGIVVTMILITFSYAIAGFLIDLMYVTTALGIALLGPAGYTTGQGAFSGSLSTGTVQADYLNGGFLALFRGIFGPLLNLVNPFSGAFSVVSSALQQGFQPNNFLPGLISGTIQVGSQLILGPLLTLIMLVAFLIAFVRIFFMLLSSYINIILAVIIAPLQLLLGALPGGDGFGSWAKNIITNLIAFPITILVLIIANWLGSSVTSSQINALWVPPLLPQPGGGGGNAAASFAYTIIWLGLIMSIPTLVGGIKEALKSKGLPAGVGAIAGPIMSGGMQGLNILYQLKFLRAPQHGKGMVDTEAGERATTAARGPK